MLQIRAAVLALACLAAGAAGFGLAWAAQGWRADAAISKLEKQHATERKTLSDAATTAAEQAARQQAEWQDRLAALDEQHSKELSDAKSQIDGLRAELRTGARRVFVRAQCPADPGRPAATPGAARVDDAASRAELDPAFADALAGIASDGDSAIRQLSALQDYVRKVCK
jgi:prophage endopeptidase